MIQIQFDPETEREIRKTDQKSRQRLSQYIENLVAQDLEDWFEAKPKKFSKDSWCPNFINYSQNSLDQDVRA